jgi:hypothetical protein
LKRHLGWRSCTRIECPESIYQASLHIHHDEIVANAALPTHDLYRPSGATDEQVAAWLDQNGIPKTADEIKAWSDSVEAIQPYQDPEQRDWLASECARLGIDPVKSRLCDYLDTDDRLSFAK